MSNNAFAYLNLKSFKKKKFSCRKITATTKSEERNTKSKTIRKTVNNHTKINLTQGKTEIE